MKQVLTVIFCILMSVVQVKGEMASGDGWTLAEDGTLTVGKNFDYSSSKEYPWYGNRGSIVRVVFTGDVTSIGRNAFDSYSTLTSVEIPSSVTSIGNHAFFQCARLTSVEIPNGVKSIGELTFSSCWMITSVAIPSSVVSIGREAFTKCGNLASIKVDKGNEKYDSRNDCNAIIETGTNTLIVACMNTTIPNGVKSIGREAFDSCDKLKSIKIPSSVTSIGEFAFDGCSGLTSIEIPSSVTSIAGAAFKDCSGLTSIKVAEDNEKYDSRDDCNAIIETETSVLIAGCMNTTIPSGVTSIKWYAFSNCAGLKSVEIPSSVTSIGTNAFYSCSGLTSVVIPSGVTSIGSTAFRYCTGLTSVEIPSSVTSIGEYAFTSCYKLTSVKTLSKTPLTVKSNIFSTADMSKATLYVPEDAVEAYKTADVWKNFGEIVGIAKTAQEKADEEASEAVEKDIEEIGEVENTDECRKRIETAREAYDKLTETQQELVRNYSKLTTAEETYAAYATRPMAIKTVWAVEGGSWYDKSGRKLAGKPTRKGVYVHGGKIEIVK